LCCRRVSVSGSGSVSVSGSKKGTQSRIVGHVSWIVLVLSFAVLVLDNRNRFEGAVAIRSRFDKEVEYRALP